VSGPFVEHFRIFVSGIRRNWAVRGSNPGGGEIFAPVQTGSGAQPTSCTMGTGSLPRVKSGVKLTPQPLLVSLVMKE
jgi:hypothetical protein